MDDKEYTDELESLRKLRRSEKGGKGFQNFAKESPFLIVSFFFHLVVLLLLALITAQEPREVAQRIRVNVEEIHTDEVEIQPLVTETDLSTDPMASGGVGGGEGAAGGEGFADAEAAAGDVEAPSLDVLGMQAAVGGGDAGQWGDRTGDGFDLAGGEGVGLAGAVDQFAVVTMNSAAQGRTLVVLVIDRTRSVVYLNLPRLIERMDHYFDALHENLTSSMLQNARWVVVGYGQEVTFHTTPTDDLDHLKSALRGVEICPTGRQNLGAALNTVLDRYGDYGHRRMLIATMTDGYGSDLRDGALLERTIRRMRESRASFFVFGHEAAFSRNSKFKSLTLDPDLLQPEDRAAIRGFEGQTIHGWVHAGPEGPRQELWRGNRNWGWGNRNFPASGFGMYAMNRIVLATGGIYFLLEEESDWDDEKLYAQYAPDMCSVHEYDRRMREEPLRAALTHVWGEMNGLYLPRSFRIFSITTAGPRDHMSRADDQIRSALQRAVENRRYVKTRAEQLQELLERPDVRSMNNYTRWRAHTQVTIAELKRMYFMFGQYAEVLKRYWDAHRSLDFQQLVQRESERRERQYRIQEMMEKHGTIAEAGKQMIDFSYHVGVGRGRAPEDFVGPREARDEYDAARQYAQIVMEEHSGTPWEWFARTIQRNVYPFRCGLGEHVPHHGGTPTTRERRPSPPSLPL